jgi:hypothetical protein
MVVLPVLQAQYLRTVLCMGEQYFTVVLQDSTLYERTVLQRSIKQQYYVHENSPSGLVIKDSTLSEKLVHKVSTCEAPWLSPAGPTSATHCPVLSLLVRDKGPVLEDSTLY